jgi:hypothetical protein
MVTIASQEGYYPQTYYVKTEDYLDWVAARGGLADE